MKLADLNPQFVGTSDKPGHTGWGIKCDCPCGKCGDALIVPFKIALDGHMGPYGERGWDREGDTLETLTLRPSILRVPPESCGWHGYLTNGEFKAC